MLLGHPASIIAYLTFAAFPPFAVIVTLVRELQPENAQSSMLVTLSGIVTFVSPLQSQNALDSMFFTLFGIVMLVRL